MFEQHPNQQITSSPTHRHESKEFSRLSSPQNHTNVSRLIDMMDETEVTVLQNYEQSADRKKSTLDPSLTKDLQGTEVPIVGEETAQFMKGHWPDNSSSSEEEEEDSRNRELYVDSDYDDIDPRDYQIQFDDVVLDGNRMSENYHGNTRFRKLVIDFKPAFDVFPFPLDLAQLLVEKVQPGRFVKIIDKSTNPNTIEIMNDNAAVMVALSVLKYFNTNDVRGKKTHTPAIGATTKAKNRKYSSDDETETVTVTPNNNDHRNIPSSKRVPSHDLMSPSNKVSDNSDDNSTSDIKVQSCDIVSYRGAASSKNEGNARFRELVREFKRSYDNNTDDDYRWNLAETIVDRLKPGRFIKYDDRFGTSNPKVLDHKESVRKALFAMRDCSAKIKMTASDKPVSNVHRVKRKSDEVTTVSKKLIKKEATRAVMQTAPKKEPRHLLQKNKMKTTKKTVEKKQKHPKPIEYEGVKSCDIVSRRGAASSNNEGNIRFRELVRAFKPDYERNNSKEYRWSLAETIVTRLKPGRFIKYEDGSDEPIILDHKLSVRKALFAMRDL